MSRSVHLVHRGSVEASAFVVDGELLGAAEARRRVLALWEPGATVHRKGAELVVGLPAPCRVRSERALGLPLTLERDVLLAAPLDLDALDALGAPARSIVRFSRGDIEIVSPRDLEIEDAAAWLDLEGWSLLEGEALGDPPLPPPPPAPRAVPATRAMFQHAVPKPPPEMKSVLDAVARLRAGTAPRPATTAADAAFAPGRAWGWLPSFLGAIGQLLARLVASVTQAGAGSTAPSRTRSDSTAKTSRSLAVRDAAPAGPGLLSRWLGRFNDLIARALLRTRLADYFGRRQAEYLDRMMQMFERGDLADALRHAIPLGSDDRGPARPALGVPSPRADLAIHAAESGASSSILLAGGFFADLRQTYRRAFERLDAAGRVDEAAFVLAELLHANEEAVSYLERHERLRLAAEIAEARGLPAGLVVRQWFLAGERERAVRLARKSSAFADAVDRLERSGSPAAEPLRLLWAEALADKGDFAAAVDVAAKVARARRLVQAWMDRGIDQGGASGAALLARKLDSAPEAFAEARERSTALLAADHEDAALERSAFARTLLVSTSRQARAFKAPTARAVLRDVGSGAADPALLRRLVSEGDDAALRADVPARFFEAAAPAGDATLGDVAVRAHDAGTLRIFDLVRLARGRFLVALGEGGVLVLAPDGRRLAHFDQPAHALVPSDSRDRAIAVARRGDAVRLARIDVAGRRSEPWTETLLDAWARDFDGSEWIVARRDAVSRLDATLPRLESLDTISLGAGAIVTAIARRADRCAFVARFPGERDSLRFERWRYDLPAWTLRARTDVRAAHTVQHVAVTTDGACVAVRRPDPEGQDGGTILDLIGDAAQREHVAAAMPLPDRALADGRWIVLETKIEEGRRLSVLDQHSLEPRGSLHLAGSSAVTMRIEADRLVVGDDRGRLIVVDLARARLAVDLRI